MSEFLRLTKTHPIAATIGGVLGLAVSIVVLVYLPMKANYKRNGCVWLECSTTRPALREGGKR